MDPAVLELRVAVRWVRHGWIFTWDGLLASPPAVLPRSGHRGHPKGQHLPRGRGHEGGEGVQGWPPPCQGSQRVTCLCPPPTVWTPRGAAVWWPWAAPTSPTSNW